MSRFIIDETIIKEKQLKQKREEIINQINELELKSFRSMRALLAGDYTADDLLFLQNTEKKIMELRLLLN